MDPHEQFCHNPDCPDRGQGGRGNIGIHSRKDQRYRCSSCGQSFAATAGTPFYRLRTGTEMVTRVLTLLCQGCPLQAMVAVEDAPMLTNQAVLTAGMYRVGCAYNFGGYHDSLRRAAPKNGPPPWPQG
jgi:hypothetical protein